MPHDKVGVYIFKDDCRLNDNATLEKFCESVDSAIFVYHWSPQIYWCNQTSYAEQRQIFLAQSLSALEKILAITGSNCG